MTEAGGLQAGDRPEGVSRRFAKVGLNGGECRRI